MFFLKCHPGLWSWYPELCLSRWVRLLVWLANLWPGFDWSVQRSAVETNAYWGVVRWEQTCEPRAAHEKPVPFERCWSEIFAVQQLLRWQRWYGRYGRHDGHDGTHGHGWQTLNSSHFLCFFILLLCYLLFARLYQFFLVLLHVVFITYIVNRPTQLISNTHTHTLFQLIRRFLSTFLSC